MSIYVPKIHLEVFTKDVLHDLCEKHSEPVSGNKPDLVARLVEVI